MGGSGDRVTIHRCTLHAPASDVNDAPLPISTNAVSPQPTGTMGSIFVLERTDVDVRIGVTQTARDIAIELADDIDREAVKAKIDAALTGAVDVLWLTDKKGRDVAVAAAKIAFVEIGTAEGDRRIGFGG
jgi:hypothetical protein